MRKNRIIIILFTFLIFCSIQSVQAQRIRFSAYKSADGTMDKRLNGIYSWGAWHPDNKDITIDLNSDSVIVGKTLYSIIEKPKRWIIKKNLKYVSFACADDYINKVNVKLFQYDNGSFCIFVMGESNAKKYSVKYLGEKQLKTIITNTPKEKKNAKDTNKIHKKEKKVNDKTK
ncbi:MAG TPA: hypothetical protein PKW49_12515 [Paludibacteraceae bacterium]|nr:hypothetical protein [Paludibacteraceae bacterium]HOU69377.1 hypothetical protein [Paludibacteraceae bacterium]HQF51076.1 hypothetical protein [Paludibacteraceae bacterium]